MAAYESDITRFIREMKQQKPDLERKQREARAIWWDKQLDDDQIERGRQSEVPRPGYIYFAQPRVTPAPRS